MFPSVIQNSFLVQAAGALVGRTPLLTVNYRYLGRLRRIFVKAENFNLTGSVKDRMALHILRKAYERGTLKPGAPIAEATSGNTGISFSALGRALGHPVTIFLPDWMSQERKVLIRSLGGQIRLVSREEGGFLGSVRLAKEMQEREPLCFLPSQFSNTDNVAAHYESTGPEILAQLAQMSLQPEAFLAGVGTGGTVMGVGTYLREHIPTVRIHPLEPANSPTLSTGHKVGKHRIQGISDEFIPDIVKLDQLDEVQAVDDGDAILMAQLLASQLGLGVGISSGANLLGAIKLQDQMGGEAIVVTIFPDDNKKYLSTDLMRDEPVKPAFLSPLVELISYEAMRSFGA